MSLIGDSMHRISSIIAALKRPPGPDYGFRYNVDVKWPKSLEDSIAIVTNLKQNGDRCVLQIVRLNEKNTIALCRNWQGSTTAGDVELWLRTSKPRWWSPDAEYTVEMYSIGIIAASLEWHPEVEIFGERPGPEKKVAHANGVFQLEFDNKDEPHSFSMRRLLRSGGFDPNCLPIVVTLERKGLETLSRRNWDHTQRLRPNTLQ